MIIAVDEAIPYWDQAFARCGEVRPFPGRRLRSADVREADALIVRSVTKVDRSLLDGSSVQFVGSATIGMDHVDEEYLGSRGIQYTNAAGCNANAVSEYVVAALMAAAGRKGWTLHGKSIAIIGVGNVGSRVETKALALGMNVLLCDPPLRDSTGDPRYLSSLEDVLGADILTFHVPLATGGPYSTYHMVDRKLLQRLSSRQFLINSSRGPVFAGSDLRDSLKSGKIEGAVLDVWEGEPEIDLSLFDLLELGTPHIAGYSIDGKIRATEMMYEALCRHFQQPPLWDTHSLYPRVARIKPESGLLNDDAVRSVVFKAYDIFRDDSSRRALRSLPQDEFRAGFDQLRNKYPFRPEFRHFIVELSNESGRTAETIRALGFQVISAADD